jgi:[acyl-carrier-protein] S-malonyltransferase
MASAQAALAEAAAGIPTQDAAVGIVSNRDGTLVHSGAEILTRLVEQVCLPVRWDACMRTMATLGVTATIELSPAGTLTGMIKRGLPDVTAIALRTPDDLDAARAAIAEHGTDIAHEAPDWRVLVAPAGGTVRLPEARLDGLLSAGDVVAHVTTRSEELAVTAGSAGQLLELLVHDGDPVSLGQPLARIAGRA